ncbi:MAG TPA: hypothetical protein VHN80_13080, partial [Kineosporiaceae bacterium]|nr:hypothetical protein [Kineosporiaceae bacterium]
MTAATGHPEVFDAGAAAVDSKMSGSGGWVAREAEAGVDRGTGAALRTRFPPRPSDSSWPATTATREQVLQRCLAAPFALDNPSSQRPRRMGLVTVVNWLQAWPGDTWQQRWLATGAQQEADWRDLVAKWAAGRSGQSRSDEGKPAPYLASGLLILICADVIRPDLC